MYFSIVIPLYNKEQHVRRAVDSILKQTYQNFEIIVVDDGSTDNSFEEVKKINDSRINIFRKSNAGVSSARNLGIRKSSYDFIGFLDADDNWDPLFLESISKVIHDYPQVGAYATSYEFKSADKIRPANINIQLKSGQADIVDYFKGAFCDPLISASSVVIKKSVFNEIGFFMTQLDRGEDLEMWCRIALKYQIVFLNKVLATYYLDTDNKATHNQQIYSTSFMSYVEEILDKQKRVDNTSFYFEEYMIRRIMNKVRYLIENNEGRKARNILYKYRYTKLNKKIWFKNYILGIKPVYYLYKRLKKNI